MHLAQIPTGQGLSPNSPSIRALMTRLPSTLPASLGHSLRVKELMNPLTPNYLGRQNLISRSELSGLRAGSEVQSISSPSRVLNSTASTRLQPTLCQTSCREPSVCFCPPWALHTHDVQTDMRERTHARIFLTEVGYGNSCFVSLPVCMCAWLLAMKGLTCWSPSVMEVTGAIPQVREDSMYPSEPIELLKFPC